MSNYRDDVQETAVAANSTWVGLRTLTGDSAKVTAKTLFTLILLHTDTAVLADEALEQGFHVVDERAGITNTVLDHLTSLSLSSDGVNLSERFAHSLQVIHSDRAVAKDKTVDLIATLTTDTASLSDSVIGHRQSYSLINEQALVSDISFQAAKSFIQESVAATDSVSDSFIARDEIEDIALAKVLVSDAARKIAEPAYETAQITSEVEDALHAVELITEVAVVNARAADDEAHGLAWTACVDGWAMSCYRPFSFTRLAVIDGVIYGENTEGVFALSGGVEDIEGHITTGKLDMSDGFLTHPVAAYLEYELSGLAEMDVTTTQSGEARTFTYTLPQELADHLTNGRFQFGRGLRGRHFSYSLRVKGRHCRINDLFIQTAQGKRRV